MSKYNSTKEAVVALEVKVDQLITQMLLYNIANKDMLTEIDKSKKNINDLSHIVEKHDSFIIKFNEQKKEDKKRSWEIQILIISNSITLIFLIIRSLLGI